MAVFQYAYLLYAVNLCTLLEMAKTVHVSKFHVSVQKKKSICNYSICVTTNKRQLLGEAVYNYTLLFIRYFIVI